MAHIYHIRISPDTFGNPATDTEIAKIKDEFLTATQQARKGIPAVVATDARVTVEIMPVLE